MHSVLNRSLYVVLIWLISFSNSQQLQRARRFTTRNCTYIEDLRYTIPLHFPFFSFVDRKLSHKILSPKSAFLHQSKFPRREYTENDVYYCVLKKTERIKIHKRQMIYTLFLARRTRIISNNHENRFTKN